MATHQIEVAGLARDAGSQTASLIASWEEAWNAHDVEALAVLVAPDVEFVNVAGRWLRGRKEFFAWHRMIHEAHLCASTWTTTQSRARALRPDLILVHLEWTINGERGTDGTPRHSRSGIFSWIVLYEAGRSLIAAAHNTNLADAVVHRFSGPPQANGPRPTEVVHVDRTDKT
jgi:uncharacterized protein (TIGR02246 family)